MPRVLNKRTDQIPPDAVYVGRPSRWGNPFKMNDPLLPAGLSRVGKRRAVITEFRCYLVRDTKMLEAVRQELLGKDLVCWCHTWDGTGDNPNYCHADILLEIANA